MSDLSRYLRNMLQLTFAPTRGWEDLDAANRGVSPEQQAADAQRMYLHCYLPAIGVCALSAFVRLLYSASGGVLECLQNALINFVALFLGAQIGRWVMAIAMPRLMSASLTPTPQSKQLAIDNRAHAIEMICYSLTFMGIVFLLGNVIKVHISLLAFLPFYAVFIIWKGWSYMGVDSRNVGPYMIVATAATLGSVYLVKILLNALV